MSVVYTAVAESIGDGRNGSVRSSDGMLDLKVASPPELGGSGAATNPEQLFAAGYAACFHSALRMAAREAKVQLVDDTVTATVGLVKDASGFSLSVELLTELPMLEQGIADDLIAQAHRRCPYSKAIAGNISVGLRAEV
jgi:lipoyl-dependent peroxiredoxin